MPETLLYGSVSRDRRCELVSCGQAALGGEQKGRGRSTPLAIGRGAAHTLALSLFSLRLGLQISLSSIHDSALAGWRFHVFVRVKRSPLSWPLYPRLGRSRRGDYSPCQVLLTMS